jgi:outer membrane protein
MGESVTPAEVRPALASAKPVSLRDVLRAARNDVAAVRLAEATRERLESQRSLVLGSYLPVLSAQASGGWSYDNRLVLPDLPRIDSKSLSAQGSASLDWAIVDPARSARVHAATEALHAGEQASESAKQKAELTAVELYVDAIAATALVEDARLTLSRRSSQYEAISGLVHAGVRQPVDAQRAEIEVVNARFTLAIRERDEIAAFSLLSSAMGRNPSGRVRPDGLVHSLFDVRWSPDLAAALARANRAEVKRDGMLAESSKAAHGAAVLARLPVLGVSGNGNISYLDVITGQGIDGYQYGGSAFGYVKWTGLDPATWLQGPVTEAMATESSRQLDSTLQTVATEAVQAAYTLQSMRIARERADAILRIAEATRETQGGRYRTGVGSLLELLDAEGVEQQARQRRIEAARDADLAGARLLAACGLLGRLRE